MEMQTRDGHARRPGARFGGWLAALLLGPALVLAAPAATPAAADAPASESPAELVRERSNAIIETLVDQREAFAADPEKLHAFIHDQLNEIFDHEYSARLVLAQHGRGASDESVAAFAQALMDNLLENYGDALLKVDPGLKVEVKGEKPLRGGAIVRVSTTIERKGGTAVPVDYLFRDTARGWRVFDVLIEGVSYVQTYRAQFAEQLRGSTLEQVTEELRQGRVRVVLE